MTALLFIVFVTLAYFLGRFVQWVADARNIMGSGSGRRPRP